MSSKEGRVLPSEGIAGAGSEECMTLSLGITHLMWLDIPAGPTTPSPTPTPASTQMVTGGGLGLGLGVARDRELDVGAVDRQVARVFEASPVGSFVVVLTQGAVCMRTFTSIIFHTSPTNHYPLPLTNHSSRSSFPCLQCICRLQLIHIILRIKFQFGMIEGDLALVKQMTAKKQR